LEIFLSLKHEGAANEPCKETTYREYKVKLLSQIVMQLFILPPKLPLDSRHVNRNLEGGKREREVAALSNKHLAVNQLLSASAPR